MPTTPIMQTTRWMPMTRIAAAVLLLAAAGQASAGSYRQTATGVEVMPDAGGARVVRLNLMADNIVQVVKLDQEGKVLTPSLMTVAAPCACRFTVSAAGGADGMV